MKFTLSWLKDYLDTDADARTIAATLTAIGLEVDSVTDPGKDLAPFVVGEVVSAEPHPQADRLQVCHVATGRETLQVVCGAPNARTGMKGVFAAAGTTVPGTGMHLKKAKIRGVESNGMLCSENEMGISEDHSRIIELPEDAVAGDPVAPWLGMDDPVFDIEITPDRQDCLGVVGIARDLAAAGLGTFREPEVVTVDGTYDSPVNVALDLPGEMADACPLFLGRFIRGVTNAESPEWMQRRLKAVGLRPISALVDITNYITIDRARPLHVYDAAKLEGDIIVRMGRQSEPLTALDGNTYTLTPAMCVIADEEKALGLGGVIGGAESGCTDETTDVMLEAAYFDPVRTAATGRTLGIDSDARYRFERGVDPAATRAGLEFATRLILEFCGGEASKVVTAGAAPDLTKSLTLRPDRLKTLAGADVAAEESVRILAALGFEPKEGDTAIAVTVPSWRGDIDGEADLVEEVVRIWGYDRVPAVPLPATEAMFQPALTPEARRAGMVKRVLAARGMAEAVTWSFTSRDLAESFGGVHDRLILTNPISSELDAMRPSILPNLLDAIGRNLDRGVTDPALFEVGPVFRGPEPGEEATVAAGIAQGRRRPRHWTGKEDTVDVFEAKAHAEAVLDACGAPSGAQIVAEAPGWYHPGRSGSFVLGPKRRLATFGEIHPRILRAMDIAGPVVAFEVDLDAIPAPRRKATARPPLARADLPAVERDLAFVLDAAVPAADVIRAAESADKTLIDAVRVFDLYAGPEIGAGRKSLAISVRLQPLEATLTDQEIEAVMARIVAAVKDRTGGELRQ